MVSYQEYSTPVDVIATRVDLAADRRVAVPSRVSVDMSLTIHQGLIIVIRKLAKLTFGLSENTH